MKQFVDASYNAADLLEVGGAQFHSKLSDADKLLISRALRMSDDWKRATREGQLSVIHGD